MKTYFIVEILTSYHHHSLKPNIYYYRDNNKKEINVLIKNTIYPIIQKTANSMRMSTNNFSVLTKINKHIGLGSTLCFVEKDIPIYMKKIHGVSP